MIAPKVVNQIDTKLIRQYFPVLREEPLLDEIIQHGQIREVSEGTTLIRIGQYMKFAVYME